MVLTAAVLWLAIGLGDWYFRFAWFGWHRQIVAQPASGATGLFPPLLRDPVPARMGGDLTRLIAMPKAAAPFEKPRPAYTNVTDEFGFRNIPPTEGRHFPIVVVGDSFMDSGVNMDDLFGARLSVLSGLPVYNHSYQGAGPLRSMEVFLQTPRFQADPPRVVVWGFVERDIGGRYFVGLIHKVWSHENEPGRTDEGARVNSVALAPRTLHRSLPDTSVVAHLSSKVWSRVRYAALGRLTPDVVVSTGPIGGEQVLFLREAIDAMKWGPEVRALDLVLWTCKYCADQCRNMGAKLVVVLIPDKEQVYRDRLPADLNPSDAPIPPSCLWEIERRLVEEGIGVVNLLRPFQDEAAQGRLLYWPDDTHWNSDGIDMAVRLTWEEIRGLVD